MDPRRANSGTSLADLPVELVEAVVSRLNLDEIRSLRLVSRDARAKASDGRFKAFCETKAVDLRKGSLNKLSDQLVPRNVACSLQDLTINGIVYVTKTAERILRTHTVPADPDDIFGWKKDAIGNDKAVRPKRLPATQDDLSRADREHELLQQWRAEAGAERYNGDDMEALTAVFNRVRQHGKTRRLRSITLSVAVVRSTASRLAPERGGDWRPVWRIAAHTFNATVAALKTSGLSMQHLNAYNNINVCSISGFDIASTLSLHTSSSLNAALGGITSLKLSTSNRCIPLPKVGYSTVHESDPDDELQDNRFDRRGPAYHPSDPEDTRALEAMAQAPKDATGLADLLHMTPNLQNLDLHAFLLYHPHLHEPLAIMDWHFADIFRNAVQARGLHKLKKLTLRGWSLDAEDLLSLLRSNPDLESLDLRQVTVREGEWRPIFDYVCSAANTYRYLYCDVLFERLTHMPGTAYLQFPGGFYTVSTGGRSAFTLDGRDTVLKGCQYKLLPGWVVGCVEHSMWRQERPRLYGPPQGARG